MTTLPPIILRAPKILYGLAFVFFVAAMVLAHFEVKKAMGYGGASVDPIVRLTMLRSLYQAALEALYIAANGVLAQILIAIWASRRAGAAGDGE